MKQEMQEAEYLQQFVDNPPALPGSSLTNDPAAPRLFEKPPKYTSVHEATEFIFSKLLEEETYLEMMDQISKKRPIMEIAQVLLFTGFSKGMWNPDMMLLLAEPTAYILLALAERAEIDGIVIYDGDEDEERAEGNLTNPEADKHYFNSLKGKNRSLVALPNGLKVSPKLKEKLDSLPDPEPEIETDEPSLLERA
jgi:hypothetical protein